MQWPSWFPKKQVRSRSPTTGKSSDFWILTRSDCDCAARSNTEPGLSLAASSLNPPNIWIPDELVEKVSSQQLAPEIVFSNSCAHAVDNDCGRIDVGNRDRSAGGIPKRACQHRSHQ